MPLGLAGLCPTPQYAEYLQQVMDLYAAGKKQQAFDMFGRVQAFATIPGATEYMMIARGVFKETTKFRQQPGNDSAANPNGVVPTKPRGANKKPLTDAQKQFIRDALDTYLKPYMRS
jgi:hypothetical protein